MSATANEASGAVRSRAQIPIETRELRSPWVCAIVLGALTSAVNRVFWTVKPARNAASAIPYRFGRLVATTQRKDAIPERSTQGVAGRRYRETTCTPSSANERERRNGHATHASQKTR